LISYIVIGITVEVIGVVWKVVVRWNVIVRCVSKIGGGTIVNCIIEKYTLFQAKVLGTKPSRRLRFIPLKVVALVSEISGLVLRIRQGVVTSDSLASESRSPHMVAVVVANRPGLITAPIR
jgi:hypothetical protein